MRQYHVTTDADRLVATGWSLLDMVEALYAHNANRGAGYVDRAGRIGGLRAKA